MTQVGQGTMRGWLKWATAVLISVVCPLGVAPATESQSPTIRDWDDGVKYARGQNVVPVYEGWVSNPDGTFSLVFGFWNRNWEETVFLPIGADNRIEPGGPDRGQPTVFAPRRGRNTFEIVVPKDFGKKEIVWTLTSRGRTERAFGALIEQEMLTRTMVMSGGSIEIAAAAGNDDVGTGHHSNTPPVVSIDPVEPVTAPGPVTLTATVTDDGVTSAHKRERPPAVRLAWSLYRGPTSVDFEGKTTEQLDLKGGKAALAVRFRARGSYVLRLTATDAGGLAINRDVSIIVN